MKYFISLIGLFFFIIAYQNCAKPVQDLSTNTSTDECLSSPEPISLSKDPISDTEYQFFINMSSSSIDQVLWAINGQQQSSSAGSSAATFEFANPGSYTVEAAIFTNDCESPQYIASTNVDVSQAGCNTDEIEITAENNLVEAGSVREISLVNASQYIQSSIKWKVEGEEEASGTTSFDFSKGQEGIYDVVATAKRSSNPSACSTINSNTISMEVTDDSASVDTTAELQLSPEVCSVNTAGEFQCNINASISNVQSLDPDHVIRVHAAHVDQGDYGNTTILCYPNQTSQNMSWIPTTGRDIGVFVDTSGNGCVHYSTDTEKEEYANNHKVFLNIKKTAIAKCGVNKYIDGHNCENVGSGYYSADKNNNRDLCSIPDNATATGPGQSGEDNCPWECQDGYYPSGDQCLEGSGSTCSGYIDSSGNCNYCGPDETWNPITEECVYNDWQTCNDTGSNVICHTP